jgi:iron complex outermembrane recepter protein
MRPISRKILVCTLLASAMPVLPAVAYAQDTRPAASDDEAIVVTARRREEELSKVPVSVTALNADAMADLAIRNENDLQSAVPGLLIKQSGSANAFIYVIRGQTIDTYTNSPPGVLPYINEAQVVTWSASTFYDMQGIQVLKGPQGTLFGRNTTGGAVLFQTQQPTDKFEGYVSGRYGNRDAYNYQAAVNIPISDGVALRVAGSKTGGGAYIRRLDTGKRYGNLEQESIRGTLLFDRGGFKNTTMVQHTNDGGTNAPAVIYNSSFYACGNGVYNDAADCAYTGYPYGIPGIGSEGALPYMVGPISSGVVGLANAQDALGPYVVIGQNSSLRHDAESTFLINTTEVELGADLLLKNIFMWNKSWSNEENDYDGSPYAMIGIGGILTPDLTAQTNVGPFYNRAKQISNELQLQGKSFGGRLDWVLGAYYINQKNRFDSSVKFFDFFPLDLTGVPGYVGSYIPIRYTQDTNNESWALFAQGTYALTDRLNFTAGFRYTWDTTTARQLPTSDFYNCETFGCFGNSDPSLWAEGPDYFEKQKESKPSWNVSLDYEVTPDLLVYVTHRGSWRAGSFNYSVAPLPLDTSEGGNQFKPETTYDIEAGLKYNGTGLGFPTTFNISFYNQWIKNIQRGANLISPFTGTSILVTASVPKAEITGVEADLTLRPSRNFSFGGSIAYTDARFTDNVVPVLDSPALAYGPYADAPKWSGTVWAEISNDFGPNTGIVSLRGDMFFQSLSYFANLGDLIPGSDIEGYELFGARLEWKEVMGEPLTLALYGRNLTNKGYYTGGNPTGLSAGFMTAFPGFPRTYGIEARLDFGIDPSPPPPPAPPPPPPAPPQPAPPPPVAQPTCNKGPYIVFFDWDRSDITPEASMVLDSAVSAYQYCDRVPVMLAGHADRSGSARYNVGLSERRNASVRDYLTGRGIPDANITSQAFGESQPRVPTADGVRELQNRRVEVTYGPGSGN